MQECQEEQIKKRLISAGGESQASYSLRLSSMNNLILRGYFEIEFNLDDFPSENKSNNEVLK